MLLCGRVEVDKITVLVFDRMLVLVLNRYKLDAGETEPLRKIRFVNGPRGRVLDALS